MTSGVCEGMLAPSSFCWPNLGCENPLAETPKGSLGRGEGCTFPLPLWSSNRRESGGNVIFTGPLISRVAASNEGMKAASNEGSHEYKIGTLPG